MPHTKSSVEKISERSKEFQSVRRSPEQGEQTGGTESLFKEFSETLDKIAARVSERISESANVMNTILSLSATVVAEKIAKPEAGRAASENNFERADGEPQAAKSDTFEASGISASFKKNNSKEKSETSKSEEIEDTASNEGPAVRETRGKQEDRERANVRAKAKEQTSDVNGRQTSAAKQEQSSAEMKQAQVEALKAQLTGAGLSNEEAAALIEKLNAQQSARALKDAFEGAVTQSTNLSAMFTSSFLTSTGPTQNGAQQTNLLETGVSSALKGGLESGALKSVGSSGNSQNSQGFSAGQQQSGKAAEQGRSERLQSYLPPQLAAKALERVESALKEAAKSRDGKTISLRLDPPDLGAVKVDVSVREGNLHARLSAESSTVNALLRDRAHELQGALRKLGLPVDKVTVSVRTEDLMQDMSFDSGFFSQTQSGNGGESGQDNGLDWRSPAEGAAMNVPAASESILDHWVA